MCQLVKLTERQPAKTLGIAACGVTRHLSLGLDAQVSQILWIFVLTTLFMLRELCGLYNQAPTCFPVMVVEASDELTRKFGPSHSAPVRGV